MVVGGSLGMIKSSVLVSLGGACRLRETEK